MRHLILRQCIGTGSGRGMLWAAVLLAVVLAAVLPAAAIPARADHGVDLAALSDADITALLEQVNAEIVRRGIEKTATLPKGSYIAGRDLPAGRYIYTCLAQGDDWGNVTVRTDEGSGDQLMWHVVSAPENGEDPETIYVTLNEGDELKSGVPFSLTVAPGVFFR